MFFKIMFISVCATSRQVFTHIKIKQRRKGVPEINLGVSGSALEERLYREEMTWNRTENLYMTAHKNLDNRC